MDTDGDGHPFHADLPAVGHELSPIVRRVVQHGAELLLKNQEILEAYVAAEATFDSRLMQTVEIEALPVNWRANPAPLELQAIGEQ